LGNKKKSIIVVADTHFGLNTKTEACNPTAFADFLNWIKDMEKGEKKMLKIGDWGSADAEATLVLESPEKIIFLGDILELWTASDESIFASTIHLIQLLSEVNCEKIYVLGNHDRDLIRIKGKYPLGTSDIEIIEDEYWITKGDYDYCFLHGHQFDKHFELPTWKLMVLLRKPALAFGNWTWVIVALFFMDLASVLVGFGGIANIMLCALLFSISLPFLAFKVARPLWNKLRSIRYDPITARAAAADRRDKVWINFEDLFDPERLLTVVYGHTHTIGIWEEYGLWTENLSSAEGYERHLMDIMNLPSWVINPSAGKKSTSDEESIENEISNVFLYISENFAPLFIGWSAKNKKPFLIPDDVIFEKREKGNLSNFSGQYGEVLINNQNIEQKLKEIDWPEELIEKWMNGFNGS
jgi:UDP-2,3-diacylglucosamine pyrophosphatase LpxH